MGKCNLNCELCNWNGEMNESYLRDSSLEFLLDALMGEGFKPEVYFSCPDPLLHPSLPSLLGSPVERGLRSVVLVPAGTRSGRPSWEDLTNASEIFIFSSSIKEIKNSRELLRFLLSTGSNVKILLISETLSEGVLESAARLASGSGLEVWVGPPLFRIPGWGGSAVQVSEPGGRRRWMGVYGVRVTFRGDIPIRILDGPRCGERCGLLYLTPKGRIGKCPFNALEHALPSPIEAVLLLREGCGSRGEELFRFVPSIKLVTREGEELDEKELELLSVLEDVGSLSQAARMLGTTPSSVLKRIRRIESILGRSLIVGSRGGSSRGGIRLTPECEELIRRYREIKVNILNKCRFSLEEKRDLII